MASVFIGEKAIGRIMTVGKHQYKVDRKGFVHPLPDDITKLLSVGYSEVESKNKPLVHNAEDLDEISEEEVFEEEFQGEPHPPPVAVDEKQIEASKPEEEAKGPVTDKKPSSENRFQRNKRSGSK